jgi:iron complex outermembrane recepter protein
MTVNQPVRHAVRRALTIGAIAALGAGCFATHAAQSDTPQPTAAKTTRAKAPITLAQASSAQQTAPQPAAAPPAAAQLQTIVITGSLIARPAAETAEPVTIMQTSALKNMGIVNVEQAIDQITANVPGVNIAQSVGSFSGGGSFANLRDLGSARTLVLLDGERLANSANDSPANDDSVDLSGIPFSAIQSIQVLRDGASSLYGSDAIAGVINFITKKNFQGGEVDADINHPQEAGGASGDANFTFGHGDLASDGYNVMITGSYSEQKELIATQRSFSATGFDPAQGLANTNNPGTWPATVVDQNGNAWQYDYPGCAGNPFVTRFFGNCAYEYSAATDLIPKSSESSGMVDFTKTLPANNQLAVQYFYTRSEVKVWSGPTFYDFTMTPSADPAYFPTASELTCNVQATGGACSGPPDLTDPISAFWTDPGNNRFLGNINTEQRALVTFSGDNYGWDYTASLNYSQNENTQDSDGGNPNEDTAGSPAFAPGGILSNLINPFGPQSAAGQAYIDSTYLNGPYVNAKTKRWSIDANANHALGDAFNAGNPATLAMGFTVEGDDFNLATTPIDVPLFAALAFPPTVIHGSRQVQAVFAELDVPMSRHLDVDISDREDRYSDFGRTNNGKVSVRYQPSHYVTFRGSASTGFRAPSLVDLYQPNIINATGGQISQGGNPFCTPGNFNTEFTPGVCAAQGLGLSGGNRNLQPETSQNFNLGVVVEPITNLGITLDYYRILLKEAIRTIPDTAIYGNPTQFSNQYVLNASGTLTESIALGADCIPYTNPNCGYILQNQQNTGGITTDGVDLSIQYLQHTSLGIFHEDLEGTAITQYRLQEYTGGPTLNLVGWFNEGNLPALRWQHTLRVDWTSPNGTFGGGLDNRFFSSYIDQFGAPFGSTTPRTVASQSTWDAYVAYKPIVPLTILFGIRNLFNKNPPFSNTLVNFTAGYNSVFSDPLLRTFYVNLKYEF